MTTAFAKAIESRGSPTALAALEALRAAFWLLAAGEVPQSLSALHHAIELALKGLLEEIDPALTATVKKLKEESPQDYDCLKHILADKIRLHPLGQHISIPNRQDPEDAQYKRAKEAIEHLTYDPGRTIHFKTALGRIQEMLQLQPSVTTNVIKRFHEARNEIVHSGDKPERKKEYLECILTIRGCSKISLPIWASLLSCQHDGIVADSHCSAEV
jgi:hypothetical protein